MRFLQMMLAVVWLAFAWLCFSALQWEVPMEPPWHARPQLEMYEKMASEKHLKPEALVDRDIAEFKFYLLKNDLSEVERAYTHATLAKFYWLKAYQQKTFVRQKSYLELALSEMYYAVDYYTSQKFNGDDLINQTIAQYEYNLADLYHQLKKFPEAEAHYLEAMRRLPGNPMFYRRYTEMIKESGLPQKIDYDTYYAQKR